MTNRLRAGLRGTPAAAMIGCLGLGLALAEEPSGRIAFEDGIHVPLGILHTAQSMGTRYRLVWRQGESEPKCLDIAGRPGYNRISREQLLATKDGECADFEGLNLAELNAPGLNLRGAKLEDAAIAPGSDLTGADLSWARLSGVYMDGVVLDEARLDHARLRGAFIDQGASLVCARLNHADLSNVSLTRAYLWYADFSGADMTGADTTNAWHDGAFFDSKTKLPFPEEIAIELGMIRKAATQEGSAPRCRAARSGP